MHETTALRHTLCYLHFHEVEYLVTACLRDDESSALVSHRHARPKTPQTCCKLSILPTCWNLSTSCKKLNCQFHQVATRLLKSVLLQSVICNQLTTSLLTNCNRLVVNKLSQANANAS